MNITSEYVGKSGVKYIFEYSDTDSFDDLDKTKCTQTYGVCFCDGKTVIGYSGGRKEWGLVGGTIEKGGDFRADLEARDPRRIEYGDTLISALRLPKGYRYSR